MLFPTLAVILSFALALMPSVVAQISSTNLVNDLHAWTNLTSDANGILLTLGANPNAIQAQVAADGLTSALVAIQQGIATDNTALAITPPFSTNAVSDIESAIHQFSAAQQTLSSTSIDKYAVFAQFNLANAIAQVLTAVEIVIQNLMTIIIGTVPSEDAQIQADLELIFLALEASVSVFARG